MQVVRCKDCPYFISIHAAREGGDFTHYGYAIHKVISIHAAREGGDQVTARNLIICWVISIHAAREGGDYR